MMHAAITSIGGDVPGGSVARQQRLERREGVLLTLLAEGEPCGVGEASPLPGYCADSLAEARSDLEHWQPPAIADGDTPAALIERATAALRSPAARFAVETALLDCLGRRSGLPIHRLLGAADHDRTIPVSHLLTIDHAAEQAVSLRARGVRHLKLKVGADLDAEFRALCAVRAAVGEAEIRLDANQRLAPDDAVPLCREFAAAGAALIEEPCPPDALAESPPLAMPVALDESLARADAAALASRVARSQTLAVVVLKPTLLGGFMRCLSLAALGRRFGAHPIVTHVFDGPVAMAAAAEMALALPDTRVAGLAPHPYLPSYPRLRGAALGEVWVTTHDGPGLGMRAGA